MADISLLNGPIGVRPYGGGSSRPGSSGKLRFYFVFFFLPKDELFIHFELKMYIVGLSVVLIFSFANIRLTLSWVNSIIILYTRKFFQ